MGPYKPIIQEPKKMFIAFLTDSGEDIAEHLHNSLHRRGVDAFISTMDIEEGLEKKEWEKQRDEAIQNCDVFILVATDGFNLSKEIKKELTMVLKMGGVEIRAFIDKHIKNNKDKLTISLDGGSIYIRDFQCRTFDTKESLVREVTGSIPLMKIVQVH